MPDIEEFRARLRLYELLDEFDITGRVRSEMVEEPERAIRVLSSARSARGPVRNRAALAVSRWRAPALEAPADELELEDAPPTLAALEHAWSRSESVQAMTLPLLALGIERHGGFRRLK